MGTQRIHPFTPMVAFAKSTQIGKRLKPFWWQAVPVPTVETMGWGASKNYRRETNYRRNKAIRPNLSL
jgi:hypothetical protein